MKKIFGAIASFLASINLTIILLSVATLIFILQIAQDKLVFYFPSWQWLSAAGKFDFYHSRGFFVLFALFCINLIGCTLKRLPRTIAVLKSSSKELDETLRTSLPICETVAVSDYQAARQTLLAHGSRLLQEDRDHTGRRRPPAPVYRKRAVQPRRVLSRAPLSALSRPGHDAFRHRLPVLI